MKYGNKYSVSQENRYSVKTMLLLKNPQFLPNHFLIKAYFWLSIDSPWTHCIWDNFFLNISGLQKYELGTALILLHDKLKMEDPKKHEELRDNLVQEIRQNLEDTIDVILPYESPDNQLCLVARNAEAELSQFNHSIVDSCSSLWIEWPDYFKHGVSINTSFLS